MKPSSFSFDVGKGSQLDSNKSVPKPAKSGTVIGPPRRRGRAFSQQKLNFGNQMKLSQGFDSIGRK